ncbi:MAG: hypothetical protein RIA69_00670 [Cyclobacteriaceae bacterium]
MKNSIFIFLLITGIFISCQPTSQNKEEGYVPVNDKVRLTSFPYAAPDPVNGQVYGLVELGGSGFNSFIIEKDEADRWKMVKSNYGVSKVLENELDEEAIKKGLAEYVDQMLAQGVKKDFVYFIQSSTASKDKKVQALDTILREMGYNVVIVDVAQEAEYAFFSTMPKEFQEEAFVVDIGSGNTKISWLEEGVVVSRDAPGSKYYQRELNDSAVYNQVYDIVTSVPADKRKKCFMIGGVPFSLASENQEFAEQYTVLNEPTSYVTEDAKVFSGLNIYKAVSDAAPEAEGFIFDWYGNFTIGYLLQGL